MGQLRRFNPTWMKRNRRNPKKKIIKLPIEKIAELKKFVLNSPESAIFQNQMESLTKKLFPKIDLNRKPIKFFISDEDEVNAFIILDYDSPVVCFTKGLLQKTKYFEDIGGILGHELTHEKFSEAYGVNHRNTKLEELAADAWPVVLLADAGFDPRQYVNFAKKTTFTDKKETLEEIIDVHPTNLNRIRALEDGLAVVDKKSGGFSKRKPTLLPPELIETIQKAKHHSYIDLALDESFQKLPTEHKIDYLHELALKTTNWNPRRISDLSKVIKNLKIKRSKPEERAAQDRFADALLSMANYTESMADEEECQCGHSQKLHNKPDKSCSDQDCSCGKFKEDPWNSRIIELVVFTLYQALVSQISIESDEVKPIGRLKIYENLIYDFMEAETAATALKISKTFLNLLDQETLRLSFLGKLVTWPLFKIPTLMRTKKSKVVPWNQLLDWATQDHSGNIANMLLALGIVDNRIFQGTSADFETSYQSNKLKLLLPPLIVEEEGGASNLIITTIKDVEIDDSGRILPIKQRGIPKTEIKKQAREEKEDNLQETQDRLKDIEHSFLEIVPGDKKAEEELIADLHRLLGDKSREHEDHDSRIFMHWIALRNAEHNFRLFLELNRELLQTFRDESRYASPFAIKLQKMALSKDKNQIQMVKGLYLGFDKNSPLHEFSFRLEMVTGFPLPIFKQTSPIIQFIIDNPGKIFSKEEQEYALVSIIDPTETNRLFKVKNIYSPNLKLVRKILGYSRPNNGEEYINLVGQVQKKYPGRVPIKNLQEKENLQQKERSSPSAARVYRMHEFGTKLIKHGVNLSEGLFQIETTMLTVELRLLVHKKNLGELDLDKFISLMHLVSIEKYPDLRSYFRSLIKRKKWPEDLELLIDQWVKIYHADLFPSDQILCYHLLDQILNQIPGIKSPENQVQLYEKLLFGQHIKDPKVRSKIEKLWIESIYERFGIDVGDRKYTAEIQKILDRIRTGLNLNDRIEVTSKLASKLQTQERLTRQCKSMLKALTKDELESSQLKGTVLEAAIKKIRTSKSGREGLIDYLTNPLTDTSLDEMHQILEHEAEAELSLVSADLVRSYKLPRKRVRAELRFLWENFWAAPFEIRTILFENLLFPDTEEGFGAIESIFDYVNNRLFPLDEEYSGEARKFLRAYFKVIPDYQYRILLSAMMVTAEKSNEQKLEIGQRLALVLELLGPAETKLGQVIHSHPKTPLGIKRGMGRLKSQADPPFRWDLLDYYRNSVPAKIRAQVIHLGKLLGSASFFLALEADMKDGSKGVLKLLRPNALERAENGFQIMLDMLKVLELDKSTIQTLEQMILQAQRNSLIETNHEISVEQTQFAITLYDGRQVILNGETFFLHVPKTISFGTTYQYMEKAPGKHFNDLPEKTPEQIEYKKKLAIVYFTFEIITILRGGRFDSDRHGAQLRIKENDLYLFDWGGLTLNEPSPEERARLGETLFDVFMAIQSGANLDDALLNAVQTRADKGENVDYLLNIQKALLSLEDFRHYISNQELLQILSTVIKTSVHQDIINSVLRKAFGAGIDMEHLNNILEHYKPIDIIVRRRRR